LKNIHRSFEGQICLKHGLAAGESLGAKEDHAYLYICPDKFPQKERERYLALRKSFMVKIEVLSVYWLYLSHYFLTELRTVPFEQFNDSKLEEGERLRGLQKGLLKLHFPELSKRY